MEKQIIKKYIKWIDNQYGFVEVIPPEKAREIIDKVDFRQALELAWKGYVPRMRTGYCVLELKSGKVQTGSLAQNESNQPIDDQEITLFTIDRNIEFSDEDLFAFDDSEFTMEQWEDWKMEGLSQEEIAEKIGEDSYKERCFDAIWSYCDAHLDADIEEQLQKYYADFENEFSQSYIEKGEEK